VAKHLPSLHKSFLIKEFLEKYPAVVEQVDDLSAIGYPIGYSGFVENCPPVPVCLSSLSTQEESSKKTEEDKNKEESSGSKVGGFVIPTIEDVRAYCAERHNRVDPEEFVDFYTANGWVQGRAGKPIKDWQAAVRTWEKKKFGDQRPSGNRGGVSPGASYDPDRPCTPL